ncbi:MAG TPA: hypothetical protein VFG79_09235 [Solirubrobacter sp.]|nr:hypothetical protein [Solirubrobacter sp.]
MIAALLIGLGNLARTIALTGGVRHARRFVGGRMLRVVDGLAGLGLLGFGGLVDVRVLRD